MVCVYACIHVCMWRAEVHVGCPPQSVFILLFETESLVESGAHQVSCLARSFRDPSVHHTPQCPAFYFHTGVGDSDSYPYVCSPSTLLIGSLSQLLIVGWPTNFSLFSLYLQNFGIRGVCHHICLTLICSSLCSVLEFSGGTKQIELLLLLLYH